MQGVHYQIRVGVFNCQVKDLFRFFDIVAKKGCASWVHNILTTVMTRIVVDKSTHHAKPHYNIASRATQSNSVYVSVLKIPIVLADGVSKSLRQNFFFAGTAIVSVGKNIIFRYNNGYKQRLSPLAPKRRQFSDHFSWARVLKWGVRKREKQRKRRLSWHGISAITIRFTVRG